MVGHEHHVGRRIFSFDDIDKAAGTKLQTFGAGAQQRKTAGNDFIEALKLRGILAIGGIDCLAANHFGQDACILQIFSLGNIFTHLLRL